VSDLVWRSIGALARAIAGREVSPVEVVQAHLDRIAALDSKLRAFITVSADAALAAAKAAEAGVMAGERLGVLHGVPLALKDLYMTRGVRTTGGSRILADWIPDEDATVVTRLAGAGAINLGSSICGSRSVEGLNAPRRHGTVDASTRRICGSSSAGRRGETLPGTRLGHRHHPHRRRSGSAGRPPTVR
jgi:Asp-tRNA(Asn)/Glu-tRNA(Gln) amidotransferase A subunit family amidase